MKKELNFNDGQLAAIRHVNGPMMALAGPGSGKTTAMVHRIKYLIEVAGVLPANILVITFTRASAREMEQRFIKLMGDKRYPCTFGTFHSVFFYILKQAYGYQSSNVLSEDEKYKVIRELLKSKELEFEDEEEVTSTLVQELGTMVGDMIPLEHFYSSVVGEEIFRDIHAGYESYKAAKNKLDFDDMLIYCYELLRERQDILKALQKRYRYILVDEFQDINRIQYEITKMLSAPENNLFIVGDDDQSIYGFRGARPEIMLNFEKDFPDVKKTLFDINYRCSRNITDGALRLIGFNTVRFTKALKSSRDFEEPIRIHHMKNIKEEGNHILSKLMEYHKTGIPYSEIAIIMRTNVQARHIVNKLMEYNVPFQIRDQVPCIYDHFAVKNVLDYIRAAMGDRERALFLRIMNKPKRYLSRELLDEPVVDFDDLREKSEGKKWAIENIDQFEYELKVLSGLKPFAAVNFIRKAIGYDNYLKEYAEYRHINEEEFYGVLDELEDLAKQYKTFGELFDGIEVYRNELKKHERQNEARDGVVVTTMHSAKGLEFDVVMIVEANESLSPYKKAVLPEEIEEERRLFYVAMTRARTFLHIYEVKDYYNKELTESRFLEEILDSGKTL